MSRRRSQTRKETRERGWLLVEGTAFPWTEGRSTDAAVGASRRGKERGTKELFWRRDRFLIFGAMNSYFLLTSVARLFLF